MEKYYLVKARYEKVLDSGATKTVTEQFLVKTSSFGRAEEIILKELGQYVKTEINITSVAITKYADVALRGDGEDVESFFKCKVLICTLDTRGNEKNTPIELLVEAETSLGAHKATEKYMASKYISSYNIELIKETKIIQVVNDEQ